MSDHQGNVPHDVDVNMMLEFEKEMFRNILQDDGLLVSAK